MLKGLPVLRAITTDIDLGRRCAYEFSRMRSVGMASDPVYPELVNEVDHIQALIEEIHAFDKSIVENLGLLEEKVRNVSDVANKYFKVAHEKTYN